ncbi:MAG TPA: thymidine kinase [Candidatus Babeliales bacterium]|nr:thymidine kinase [Candidatus Babeliales bacterium]
MKKSVLTITLLLLLAPLYTYSKTGTLEVICGSMFAGKSEELIRRLRRAKIAQQKTICFSNALDNRYDNSSEQQTRYIASHNGNKVIAEAISNEEDILSFAFKQNLDVIGIDEVQFFSINIIPVICTLVDHGIRVIVPGLDLDFRGQPFPHMATLLALADKVTKLHAICALCGNDAYVSQRLINKQPANYDDPIILVAAQEAYQARCRSCFEIDKKPLCIAIESYE